MASKNTSRNVPIPPFRHYNNPSNNKTLTSIEEANLGELINYIRSNCNNSNDPKEEVGDLEVNDEPSNKENLEQDHFYEKYINIL